MSDTRTLILHAALEGLQARLDKVNEMIAAVRSVTPSTAKPGHRAFSEEARRRMSRAQRARWKRIRAAAAA